MTENKRFSVKDKWITDNCIGKLLNIDFNTITDANLCCGLLNQIEDEKKQNGKIASKFFEENEQLKQENKELKEGVEELNTICKYYEMRIKELSEQADAVRTELQLCEEENNALQERNDRQYEILRKLYTLIENKDWKGLTHIWKN